MDNTEGTTPKIDTDKLTKDATLVILHLLQVKVGVSLPDNVPAKQKVFSRRLGLKSPTAQDLRIQITDHVTALLKTPGIRDEIVWHCEFSTNIRITPEHISPEVEAATVDKILKGFGLHPAQISDGDVIDTRRLKVRKGITPNPSKTQMR